MDLRGGLTFFLAKGLASLLSSSIGLQWLLRAVRGQSSPSMLPRPGLANNLSSSEIFSYAVLTRLAGLSSRDDFDAGSSVAYFAGFLPEKSPLAGRISESGWLRFLVR